MASIYERAPGVWWVSYIVHGRRIQKRIPDVYTEADAESYKTILESQQLTDPDSLLVRDIDAETFWTRYQAKTMHKRPNTRAAEAQAWKQFTEAIHPKTIGSITRADVEAFRVAVKARDGVKSDATVNSRLRVLSAIVGTATEYGIYRGRNPFKGVKRLKLVTKSPERLNGEQLDTLLGAAEAHSPALHLYVALGAIAGFRKGESCWARWSWFRWDTQRIILQAHDAWTPKDYEFRELPLFSKLAGILEKYGPGEPDEYVIPSRRVVTKAQYRNDQKTHLADVGEACGVGKVKPHSLRRTFATLAHERGVPVNTIREWLGHSNIATTLGYLGRTENDQYVDLF